MAHWIDWEKEEERRREAQERFDGFIGPLLVAGLVLIFRWFLYGITGWFRSDALDELYRQGLSAYLMEDNRWWSTVALVTFAGLAGFLFQLAKSEWKAHQIYSGAVVERLVFGAVAASLAAFGFLVFY